MNEIKIQKQNSARIKIIFPNYNYSYISKIKSPLDSLNIKEMIKWQESSKVGISEVLRISGQIRGIGELVRIWTI